MMSNIYTVQLYDDNQQAFVFLEDAINVQMSGFRLNQTNGPTWSYPANKSKAAYLTEGRKFLICRNKTELFAGKILKVVFDSTKNIYNVHGETNEDELNRSIVPKNWNRLNGMDLADAVKYLLKGWEYYQITTEDEFYQYRNGSLTSQVDLFTDNDKIALSTYVDVNYHDVPLTAPLDHHVVRIYNSDGYITFDIPLSEKVTEIERLRASVLTGEAKDKDGKIKGTYITIQWALSTDGGSTFTALSTPAGKNARDSYWSTNGLPIGVVGLSGANNVLRIRFNLHTDNTTAPAIDWSQVSEGEINTLGISPVLEGFEIICRKDYVLYPGSIPAETGVKVKNFPLNRETALKVIRDLLNNYKYEFRVNSNLSLDLAETFGTIHEQPFVDGINCSITPIESDSYQLKNIIYCYGAGDGPNQLFTIVKDQASIDVRGEWPGTFEDTSITDVDDLIAAGQKELQPVPLTKFEINIPSASDTPFVGLGDTITVNIPKLRQHVTGRVVEWSGGNSKSGEVINVVLDKQVLNIYDVLNKDESIKQQANDPRKPSQIRVASGYGFASLYWRGEADFYIMQMSYDISSEDNWRNVGGKIFVKEYTATQLPVNTLVYFRVAASKDGYVSEWSDAYCAKTLALPDSDIDKTPPAVPTGLEAAKGVIITNAGPILQVTLSWTANTEGDLKEYIIERAKSGGTPTYVILNRPTKTSTVYVDTDGLEEDTEYLYRIAAADNFGNASNFCSPITVTTDQVPDAPGGTITLTVTSKVGEIRVGLVHVDKPKDLMYYEVYAGTNRQIVDSTTLAANANLVSKKLDSYFEFPAVPGQDYYIAVRAINKSDVPGLFVEPSGQPYQSRLTSRDDLDNNIFRIIGSIYSPTAKVRDLTDAEVNRLINEANAIPVNVGATNKVVFEYPNVKEFDCCVVKNSLPDTNPTISYSLDGVNYTAVSYTKTNLGNGFYLYAFTIVTARFVKLDYGNAITYNLTYFRPQTIVYADKFLAGLIDAGRVIIRSGTDGGNSIEFVGSGIVHKAVGADLVTRIVKEEIVGGNIIHRNKDIPDPLDGTRGKKTWVETPDGKILDANGYTVLDVNGFNKIKLMNGFLNTTVPLGGIEEAYNTIFFAEQYKLPANRTLYCQFILPNGYHFHGSDSSKTVKTINDMIFACTAQYTTEVGENAVWKSLPIDSVPYDRTFDQLFVRIGRYVYSRYTYTDDTTDVFYESFPLYFEILEIT